jgi:hypothetical protein
MISDTFHSGLLWAAYLLCLLLSGVQSPYPATSVVTVSANTAPAGDTYVNTAWPVVMPPLKKQLFGDEGIQWPATAEAPTADNVRVFGVAMTARVKVSTGFVNTFAAVLKDSLILEQQPNVTISDRSG